MTEQRESAIAIVRLLHETSNQFAAKVASRIQELVAKLGPGTSRQQYALYLDDGLVEITPLKPILDEKNQEIQKWKLRTYKACAVLIFVTLLAIFGFIT